jgi:hypothetical protein
VIDGQLDRAEGGGEGVEAAAGVEGVDLAVVADVDDLAAGRVDGALQGEPVAGWGTLIDG